MARSLRGAGLCTIGVSPAGYGDPEIAADPSAPVITLSRNIDSVTKDYSLDDYGRTEQMASSGQLVYLALASVTDWPRVIGANFVESVRARVSTALQPYVDARMIEIVSIQTTITKRGLTQSKTSVKWRDVSTGKEFTFGLG